MRVNLIRGDRFLEVEGDVGDVRNSCAYLDAVFYLETWKNAVARGYWRGEMSWILENNEMMNRSAKMLGGEVYKTYRLYEMSV